MNYEADLKQRVLTVHANATVRAGRFGIFQIANGRQEVAEVSTAGASAHCVILADANAGAKVQVALPGQVVTVEAGAAIAAAFLSGMVDATGRLVNHGGIVGEHVLGQAHATAAAAGDKVPFFFAPDRPPVAEFLYLLYPDGDLAQDVSLVCPVAGTITEISAVSGQTTALGPATYSGLVNGSTMTNADITFANSYTPNTRQTVNPTADHVVAVNDVFSMQGDGGNSAGFRIYFTATVVL